VEQNQRFVDELDQILERRVHRFNVDYPASHQQADVHCQLDLQHDVGLKSKDDEGDYRATR